MFYLADDMKRLIFDLVEFLIGPVRYQLSDLEFDGSLIIEACRTTNHSVTNKYQLCKIFALLFEYVYESVICFVDIVSVQVPVFGKEQFHVIIVSCQMKKCSRLDMEDTESLNSRFVKHPPSYIRTAV